jgi:NTP pyrophosphatase (non-canonical NTP hydrolase)
VNINEYQKQASRTDVDDLVPAHERLKNPSVLAQLRAAIVMLLDASEALDVIKKHVFYGKPLMHDNHQMSASYHLEFPTCATNLNSATMIKLLHAAIGMATEAGEFMNPVAQAIMNNRGIDIINLLEEVGDLAWYQALAANTVGENLDKILERNIEKLKRRYPQKFTEHDALNRDLSSEAEVLNG